jgi:hypothetical protein
MPNLVTKSIKKAARHRCKSSMRRERKYEKTRSHRIHRRRTNQVAKLAKYQPDIDIVPLIRTEMYTSWEVF